MASNAAAPEQQSGDEGATTKDTPDTTPVFPLFDLKKRILKSPRNLLHTEFAYLGVNVVFADNVITSGKEVQQKQATGPKKARGTRTTTPISLSDTEKGDSEAATTKSTKPRKPRSKPIAAKSKRRIKVDPDGEFSGVGISKSHKKDSETMTETTASTTPTLLTPMSSPPHDGSGDSNSLVDPNEGRRKRRKKTSISVQMVEDEDYFNSDFIPPPSAQEEVFIMDIDDPGGVQNSGARPLEIRECPKFHVEVPVVRTQELLLAPPKLNAFGLLMNKQKKKDEIEDEPELPSNLPEHLTEAPPGRRTPVSFDSDTGILTIRSSPVLLPSSVPPSPLHLLEKGKNERKKRKKKDEEIPELSLSELPFLEISKKTSPKKTTAKFDHETGIFTVRSSPVLGPQSPKLRPNAFSILGKKKETHPPPVQAQALPSTQALLPTIKIRQPLVKVAADKPKKTVHPFFQPGGLKKIPGTTPLLTAETRLDAEDTSFIGLRTSTRPKNTLFGSNSGAGNGPLFGGGGRLRSTLSNQVLRSPGLADAPWPSRDNCHARGLPASTPPLPTTDTNKGLFNTERKLKDRVVAVSPDEDLLLQYSRKLSIQQLKQEIIAPDYNVTRYYNTPSDVRLPERIITTGSKLQEMVQRQVSARLPHPNAISREAHPPSDSDSESTTRKKVHPTLLKLYKRIRDELTPFDKGECEPSSWGVKYAPESSQEVMQVGKETQILKEWLMGLKVESVGTCSDKKSGKRKSRSSTPSSAGGKGGVAKKKRKKKKDNELAGFIINSDEERDEMDEITDPEDKDWMSAPSGIKKSTIRAGDKGIESPFGGSKESGRLVNAVVISGPNGCGKTAAVYAVAKEVGFTVFEVSPGMRRSGKDILDQVGEMSKTHLVHQAKAISEGATSFFKPTKVQKLKAEEDALPKVVPGQQQSLILLEEVDLLFEEDKQFWSTVLTLMAQSKRPIVLTCNDENLLPLDTLPLHAILRFTPPPRELVVDQLLLICANEGHLLQRDAVESLVKSHNDDIRASLIELEFWCRMGVGDRKGGMDWMIIRWPIGADIADNGEAMKVVSKDTYIKGMGYIDRAPKGEEDKWRNIWETWEIDVGGEDSSMGRLKWSTGATRGEQMDKMAVLRVCDEYTEAMSAVDCYAGSSMVGFDESISDITQPPLSCRVRIDDMQGYPILQTDPIVKAYSVGVDMATLVRLLARRYLCDTRRCHKFTEEELASIITERSRVKQELKPLSQKYLSETFRPLSYASTLFALTPAVCHSSVNGPPSVLMLDVAPYVRGIIRHDVKREQERIKASSLLSVGGGGKRSKRATNSSRSAEEGGDRRRRERWFADINAALVEGSGGRWGELDVEGGCRIGIEVDEDGNVHGGMGSDEDGEYELESE